MGKFIDLTGKTFGKLTVLKKDEERSGKRIYWICQCSCPNYTIKSILGDSLKSGNTKSCGCYHKEHMSNIGKQYAITADITNERFGKLVAIEPTEERICRSIVWKCKCDCGNIYYASVSNLKGKTVDRCDHCWTISKGEEKIKQLLTENNIAFIQQKKFKDCKDILLLPFDFYLPQQNILIEYDGKQHYQYSNSGWNNEENFKKTQKHDAIKTKWCEDNNIPLIRIPYTKYETLCIDDLILK